MPTNEHIQRLERLLEFGRNLSASLDLEPFLQSVLSVAGELTGSELAYVLEVEDDEQLRFLAVPSVYREALQATRVPVEASVAGWVYKNAKPAVVADVASEPRHFKGIDQAAKIQTRSILAVPIVCRDETLGVLEAVNKVDGAHYTEEDLTILETLASQLAVRLQNDRLLERVRQAQDEVTHLDRMKSDFIAVASHELRTPLGLILGHATFLREAIDEQHRPQLDIIVRNAMRLKEIIDSIANMDNVERGMASVRRRTVSVKRVIEEVIEEFSDDAKSKRVSLRADIGQEELMVEGDASKIAIALTNLIKNAITFTNAGGHVFVVAEQIPGYVKVAVIDDGIGIPAVDLGRVFERFYQVESHLTRKHGGMGLGLSVAKVMVELHGGRIWVESVEGKGSSFSFVLPLDSSQADAANRVFNT